MRILLLGSSSFAARGLAERLEATGHEVFTLNRGAHTRTLGRALHAPVARFAEAAVALGQVDVLINFLLLKGEGVDANLDFCAMLCRLGECLKVSRLIHISSVSVVPASADPVDEETLPDPRATQKGEYSRIKIATEQWLRSHWKPGALVIVRPGFILAPGLVDPLVGIGKPLPGGMILSLGVRSGIVPLITRDQLHHVLSGCLTVPLPTHPWTLMPVASNSPSRSDYLEFCCCGLGAGTGVIHLPKPVWWALLSVGSIVMSLLKRRPQNLLKRLAHNLGVRRYDATRSAREVQLELRCDWQKALVNSLEGQTPNYSPTALKLVDGPCGATAQLPEAVLYIGCGRIVRERHFPALDRLSFSGVIEWWDPFAASLPQPRTLQLRRLTELKESRARIAVIATPSAARSELVTQLPASVRAVLFEKPFATHSAEWDAISEALPLGADAFVLHNYRGKANVQAMLRFMSQCNSGRVQKISVRFGSPPVAQDGATWLRRERAHRTLLMDYALHFIDLAFMLAPPPMRVVEVASQRNARGETAWIAATLQGASCGIDLLLRQGGHERRCHIEFVFENYSCELRFFPELFLVSMGRRTFIEDTRAAVSGLRALSSKLGEKLRLTAPDLSHQHVLAAFLQPDRAARLHSLHCTQVAAFYAQIFEIEQRVYGDADSRHRPPLEPRQVVVEPASVDPNDAMATIGSPENSRRGGDALVLQEERR